VGRNPNGKRKSDHVFNRGPCHFLKAFEKVADLARRFGYAGGYVFVLRHLSTWRRHPWGDGFRAASAIHDPMSDADYRITVL
jgi:hypothetical protein